MANINTLKTLQTKSDDWDGAIKAFEKTHEMHEIDNFQPVNELITPAMKITHYSLVVENTPNYSTRNLVLYNKRKEVVQLYEDVELRDGVLCVRKKLRAVKASWFSIFNMFRTPNVNVRVKR